MKGLRIVGSVLVGIILFVLIFGLSITKTTKKFFEKDLLIGLVKTSIVETLNKEAGKIEANKDAIIDEIFSDKETENIVHIVIDNFKKYQTDKIGFSVSDADVEKINSFALKYKNQISKIAGDKVEDLTDEKLKEILSKENINNLSNRIYEEISSGIGDEVDEVFKIYEKLTSPKITWITISAIVFLIIVLGLINWSLYKWMMTTGTCLVLSGIIMCITYLGCLFINEIISTVDLLNKTLGHIDFSSYIIVGGIEIIVGTILIIVYHKINNKPFNDQINNLGVGE